ncbi:amino acid permease [Rhodococcus erythropolis]|uniref:amino acid permease n=1 Tax=Rhodococcus erythropolis TaxID=1833 RepID=UPI000492D5D8|nr:amino acid permease [Rhodococcus erythropolis]
MATSDAGKHPAAEGSSLARHMKPRQLIMMSLGCAIGTGLFVGSGKGITAAGPAILVAFLIASFLVVLIMRMLGEMAAVDPSSGSISVFAQKALGRTAGATVGWLWWAQLFIVIAAEATAAASILHSLWPVASQWASALVFMVALTAINLLGVKNFGEMEFWFAVLKIGAIIVFLVIGVALLLNFIPGVPSPGFSNLHSHGGFMPNGIAGVASGLLLVVFSFGGMEIVTIAAAETPDPERNVGRAIRTVLWRIILFYVGSVLIMVTVLPWDSELLANSPFVAVLTFAGLPGADIAMSIVIVTALLSSLNANLYGASRLLFSMAERGSAPRMFARLTARSVPQLAVLGSVSFGFVAVVLNYIWPTTVLRFLLNAVGSTTIVLWSAIIICQLILRYRADRTGQRLPLRMWGFPYLSYTALAILGGVVVLSFTDAAARNQIIATFLVTAGIAVACRVAGSRSSRGESQTSVSP